MLALLLLLQVPTPPRLTQFLQQSIGFDAAQLATIERGEPVVKVLDTRDRRDVALFGIITAPVARDQYVRALRDFPTSLRTPSRRLSTRPCPHSRATSRATPVLHSRPEPRRSCSGRRTSSRACGRF